MDPQNLQVAQQILISYLNDSEQKNEGYEFYKLSKLGDFAIESLEMFEMIMKIEEALGIEIDDSVIDSELTIEELTMKLVGLD